MDSLLRRGIASAVALMAAAGTAEAQSKRPMTIMDIMDLKTVAGVSLSPDGSKVAYTVNGWEHPNARQSTDPAKPDTARPDTAKPDTAKGDKHEMRSHIWMVPAAGGAPRQFTFSERGENGPQWSPDGRSLAFLSARGSSTDSKTQIWILPMDGGEAYQLTTSKENVTGFEWAKDGSRIAFLSVDTLPKTDEAKATRRDDPQVFEENFRLSHAWVIDVATKRATEVAHGNLTVSGAPSWSPDGTRLAFQAAPTTMTRDSRSDIYVVTIADKSLTKITTKPEAGSPPAWSPDGKTIAFTMLPQSHTARPDSIMDREIGNNHLVLYDVASGKAKDTYDPKVDVSAGNPRWTPDGRRILFTTGERAWAAVYAYDVASNKLSRIVDKVLIGQPSLSRDGRLAAYTLGTPNAPADVHVSDLTFASPRKLTDVNPQVRDLALGETEVITWKSTDGMPVEGVLLKPVGYQAGRKYPLLVEAHGGPTGATNAGFKANWGSPGQVWAGQGWAVLYPNPRGSTNYGEKFTRANIMDWGGGDYRDIMTGVDDVIQRGIADSSKMAFEGWSYGGYMTSWVVTQTSRFKAARMGAGLSNLESMYGTTDIPGYIGTFFSGIPTKQTLDFYRARSAIQFVDNVTTPLLIQHGGNDQRVPVGQAMEFFRALKDRGKTVQMVFYPREGHGLSEYYHQIDKMQRELDWMTKYTLGPQRVIP